MPYQKEYYKEWINNNKEKKALNDKKRYEKNKENNKLNIRNNHLKNNYGITLDDYNIMLFQQDGCCAICKTHHTELNKNLSVDHNHTTGEVRGLLCNNCNTAIGKLGENIQTIKNAIKYLQYGKFRK